MNVHILIGTISKTVSFVIQGIPMTDQLRLLMRGYENKYPEQLEAQFPRILKKIELLWDYPEAFDHYIHDLLVADRSDRQGFPPAIASELFSLNSVHDEIHQTKFKTANYTDEVTRAKDELEYLNVQLDERSLFVACEGRYHDILLLLLKAGVNPNARDAKNWTPLLIAAFEGDEEIAILLIEHGANINVRDPNGYTPLHWAALGGFKSLVKLFIQKNADINALSHHNITPLLQAAAQGHTTATKLLLEASANPNQSTDEGWTALHKAVSNEHVGIIKLLLEHGANLNAVSIDNMTPLLLAEKSLLQSVRDVIREWLKVNNPIDVIEKNLSPTNSDNEVSIFSRPSIK